jgi:hypothetical protein
LLCFAVALGCGKAARGWPQSSLGEIDHGRGWGSINLVIDAEDKPIVGYVTASIGFSANEVFVKRWNGSTWEALGSQLNAAGTLASSVLLAVDSAGVIVVWNDAPPNMSLNDTVHAARWTGAWSPLGAQVSSASTYGNAPRFAAGAQGPIVTYTTFGSSAPGTVVRWDGSTWQKYPDTPSAGATYLDLAVLPDGTPVVSWPIWSAAGSTTVYTQRWDAISSSWVLLPSRTWSTQVNPSIAADTSGAIFLAGGPVPVSPADPGSPVLRAGDTTWDAVGAPQGGAGSYARFVKMAGAVALVNQQPGGYAVSQYLGADRWDVIADLGSGGPGGSTCAFAAAAVVGYAACPVWGTDVDASGQPVVHLLATSFAKP